MHENITSIHHKGSTLTTKAMWSLLVITLTLILSACSDNNKKDNIDIASQEVQMMYLCRIKALNKDFYLHKYNTDRIIRKYEGKEKKLSKDDQQRMVTLKSQCTFEYVDYCLQIGKQQEAQRVMRDLEQNTTLNIHSDTTQWLNYLYHTARVLHTPYNIINNTKNIENGYDALVQCYILSTRREYRRYEALTLQLLSRYFINDSILNIARKFDPASIRYINDNNTPDSILPTYLAEKAVKIFLTMDEPYLIAEAWRHLAVCYFYRNNPQRAIQCLNMALANPEVSKMPDLLASINEQLSMSFAAIDNKHLSDFYRNEYLDQQDSTRQDRMLEARAQELENITHNIWMLVAGALVLFFILAALTVILTKLRKHKQKSIFANEEKLDELKEILAEQQLRLSNSKRAAIEQRAQISVINGMIPLIDRMRLSVQRADDKNANDIQKQEALEYASEIAEAIDKQNNMLTQWIKLRRGVIEPKIETISVKQLFEIQEKGKVLCQQNNITLDITPSDTRIKADRTLTLFQINTLIDNARKATPKGGTIRLFCKENKEQGYADISVSDNGKGMTEEQCRRMLSMEMMSKEIRNDEEADRKQSHGFGMANCRGIMDRYRKISALFAVCAFNIQSTIGKGTTVTLRLPLAKLLFIATIMTSCLLSNIIHAKTNEAARLTDSLYECNIQGRYADALLFADSCNRIVDNDTTVSSNIRLTLYNETAVAALAMHQWRLYKLNNYRFNKLYKECTADNTLADYCQTIEESSMKANITMLVIIILIIALIPVFWFTYLRHVLRYRRNLLQQKKIINEEISKTRSEAERIHIVNNITDNMLSTVKHETMYYPTRIRQTIAHNQDTSDIANTVNYYRELYMTLAAKGLNKQLEAYSFSITKKNIADTFGIQNTDCTKDNCESTTILVNEELIQYLTILLKRKNKGKKPLYTATKNGQYANVTCHLTDCDIPQSLIKDIFTPLSHDTDFLIMRQIIREIGNATNRYGTGITATCDKTPQITFTIPLAG